jgi:hypothetical protein
MATTKKPSTRKSKEIAQKFSHDDFAHKIPHHLDRLDKDFQGSVVIVQERANRKTQNNRAVFARITGEQGPTGLPLVVTMNMRASMSLFAMTRSQRAAYARALMVQQKYVEAAYVAVRAAHNLWRQRSEIDIVRKQAKRLGYNLAKLDLADKSKTV